MLFTLIGRGISGSPSPAMQMAAFAYHKLPATYEICDVQADDLDDIIQELRDGTINGANVTIPHKRAMAERCDRLEGDAETLGVVNTVVREGDSLVGSNTDVEGFHRCLVEAGMWPSPGERSHTVIFGAGGTAASVVLALSRVADADLAIVARRREASVALVKQLPSVASLRSLPWDETELTSALSEATLVVNCTPAGLPQLPFNPRKLPHGCSVADVRYAPRPVDTVAAALAAGHRACDGAEMLLQQGMLSFEKWTGLAAPYDVAREALLAELNGATP